MKIYNVFYDAGNLWSSTKLAGSFMKEKDAKSFVRKKKEESGRDVWWIEIIDVVE